MTGIVLPSPVLLRRLGVCEFRKSEALLAVLLRGVLRLRPVADPSEVRFRDDCLGGMEGEVPAVDGG